MGKKIRLMLAVFFLVMLSRDVVSADCNSLDLLLKEGYTVEQFQSMMSRNYPEITVSSVPEIMLVHLVLPSSVDQESFLCHDEIQRYVYARGELPDISVPQNPLSDFPIHKLDLTAYCQYRTRMTNEEMFDAMAWHVDKVTGDRKSLDISRGKGVKIAVIDSGADMDHPVLAGKMNRADSCSFVTGEQELTDSNGHGTGVAGIIAQIAPEAEMTVYKVIGEKDGESEWTVRAVIQAANDGNHIINMSLGTYKCKDVESELLTIEAFERAIDYAEAKNCMVVASAGNKSLDLDQYYETEHSIHLPGGIEKVVTVSANHGMDLASYSNFGSKIDFCAPGGDMVYVDGMLDLGQWIYCLYPVNLDHGLSALGVPQGYSFNCGTSFAAPAVAAGMADLLSYHLDNNHEISMEQIVEDLKNGTDDIGEEGKDNFFGYGSIDIYNSLCEIDYE